jgi:hypothetical protein
VAVVEALESGSADEPPDAGGIAVAPSEAAVADWVDPDPPALAMTMPPTTARTESPAMAIAKLCFFTVPRFYSD